MKYKNTAKLIKKYRLQRDLSCRELGLSLGHCGRSFISNIENGKEKAPLKLLPRLCATLKISRTDMVNAVVMDYKRVIRKGLGLQK